MAKNVREILEDLVEDIQGGGLTSYSNEKIDQALAEIKELIPKKKICPIDKHVALSCCLSCFGVAKFNQALAETTEALFGEE